MPGHLSCVMTLQCSEGSNSSESFAFILRHNLKTFTNTNCFFNSVPHYCVYKTCLFVYIIIDNYLATAN